MSLPSALPPWHSAKSFKKMSLPSALTVGTRQRRRQRSSAVDGCFSLPSVAVGPRKRLCRVPDKWPSAKSLFAVKFFSEGSLPRAALGKAFAEGFWAFTECPGPSAKKAPPVVLVFLVNGKNPLKKHRTSSYKHTSMF